MVKTGPYVYRPDFSKEKYGRVTNYEDIESYEQFNKNIQKNGLTVCYFSKSTFNPCKYFEPIFQHISRQLADKAKFIRVDCEYPTLNKIAQHEEIRTFPTFAFYQRGVELVSIIGTIVQKYFFEIKKTPSSENLKNALLFEMAPLSFETRVTISRHYFASLFRDTISRHYFASVFRVTISRRYFSKLFRVTISCHYFASLFRVTISRHYFATLFRVTISRHYFASLFRVTISRHYFVSLF